MVFGEIVSGQQRGWSLVKKLGEGDAGEVFLVESLLDKKTAILKRPHRSAFSSDILRQAAQIETEGQLLRALAGFFTPGRPGGLQAPAVLDQSRDGTGFSERLFLVIAQAPGFDLNLLAKVARLGLADTSLAEAGLGPEARTFLEGIASLGRIPDLILLRALAGLLELFEKIHFQPVRRNGGEQAGLIWNDVKPEHLFWDPVQASFTVIDWGNGQFLEADGATKDRQFSRLNDYTQFLQEMGRFLAEHSPDLYSRLEWPTAVTPGNAYSEAAKPLRERILQVLGTALEELHAARQAEADLLLSGSPRLEDLPELDAIHTRLLASGETPDYPALARFYTRLAAEQAVCNELDGFRQVCQRAQGLPESDLPRWDLLDHLAAQAGQEREGPYALALRRALAAGLAGDLPASIWDLLAAGPAASPPSWLEDLILRARRLHLQVDTEVLPPLVMVKRLMHTLQAASLRLEETRPRPPAGPESEPDLQLQEQQRAYSAVLPALREAASKWDQPEPDPPDSGLPYDDIDRLIGPLSALQPEAGPVLLKALDQPKAQADLALEAWGRKEFETARRGLRGLLLWDPDRRRVFLAERAILSASAWLRRVVQGPRKEDTLQDFVTEVELAGREMRNQVGPARWLDLILDSFSQLRKGASPADLILEHPELLSQVPWLSDYESFRPAPAARSGPVHLEREPIAAGNDLILTSMRQGELGPEGEMLLTDSLDTWAPEARGSSARVFSGLLSFGPGQMRPAAVKLMRPNRVEYALPLFREEVQILTLMRDIPGITGLVECGFLKTEDPQVFLVDDRQASARELHGEVLRYGINETRDFITNLEARTAAGWLPYMAMRIKDRRQNLITLCDTGYTHGRFLPLAESLRLAIQICDILQTAHARNIVYRDHKILHYYWQEAENGVFMIDWNVARRHPQGLSPAERQFDLVQFGARALHHILAGRPAPGALPLGPNRPEEIEQAAATYRVQWTYDDQRLPTKVKDLIERVLSGGFTEARPLREELRAIFLQLPDTIG